MANNHPDSINITSSPASIPEGVSYSVGAPSTTSGFNAGDTWYVTPLGTQADSANATEMWRYDGVKWVKSPSAIVGVTFGTATPPTGTAVKGSEYFVTSDGTSAGTITESWIYDGTAWVKRSNGTSASALWETAIVDPTATGNTGTLPRFVENTANSTKWYIDSAGVAKLIEGTVTGQNVYIDTEDPATATIFDTENPPVTNNDALKNDTTNTYYGSDGSVWTWNGTEYVTKVYSFPTWRVFGFFASVGQTSVTLQSTPIGTSYLTGGSRGIVHVTRNGVDISRAWSWVGAVGTYNPAQNFGAVMDAGDMLQFHWESY